MSREFLQIQHIQPVWGVFPGLVGGLLRTNSASEPGVWGSEPMTKPGGIAMTPG